MDLVGTYSISLILISLCDDIIIISKTSFASIILSRSEDWRYFENVETLSKLIIRVNYGIINSTDRAQWHLDSTSTLITIKEIYHWRCVSRSLISTIGLIRNFAARQLHLQKFSCVSIWRHAISRTYLASSFAFLHFWSFVSTVRIILASNRQLKISIGFSFFNISLKEHFPKLFSFNCYLNIKLKSLK